MLVNHFGDRAKPPRTCNPRALTPGHIPPWTLTPDKYPLGHIPPPPDIYPPDIYPQLFEMPYLAHASCVDYILHFKNIYFAGIAFIFQWKDQAKLVYLNGPVDPVDQYFLAVSHFFPFVGGIGHLVEPALYQPLYVAGPLVNHTGDINRVLPKWTCRRLHRALCSSTLK